MYLYADLQDIWRCCPGLCKQQGDGQLEGIAWLYQGKVDIYEIVEVISILNDFRKIIWLGTQTIFLGPMMLMKRTLQMLYFILRSPRSLNTLGMYIFN